jgi:hypothetical protein
MHHFHVVCLDERIGPQDWLVHPSQVELHCEVSLDLGRPSIGLHPRTRKDAARLKRELGDCRDVIIVVGYAKRPLWREALQRTAD